MKYSPLLSFVHLILYKFHNVLEVHLHYVLHRLLYLFLYIYPDKRKLLMEEGKKNKTKKKPVVCKERDQQ